MCLLSLFIFVDECLLKFIELSSVGELVTDILGSNDEDGGEGAADALSPLSRTVAENSLHKMVSSVGPKWQSTGKSPASHRLPLSDATTRKYLKELFNSNVSSPGVSTSATSSCKFVPYKLR